MELAQLEAFVAVVEHGSFQAAAQALGGRRASLRSRVDALEAQLGVPLLVRTHRGTEPTLAGRRFLDRARRVVRDAQALATFDASASEEPQGELTAMLPVGLPPGMARAFLALLHNRYPALRICLALSDEPWAHLSPDVDIIVQFGDRLPRGPYRTMVLGRAPVVLRAATAYLERHGRPRSVADLADHRLVGWRMPGDDGRSWPLTDGQRLPVDLQLCSNDPNLVREEVADGLGIGLVPYHAPAERLLGIELAAETVLEGQVGTNISLRVLTHEARAEDRGSRSALRVSQDLAEMAAAVGLEPD